MISLNEQIAELDRELDLLLAGDDNRVAIEEVESALNDLDHCYRNVMATMGRKKILTSFPNEFTLDEENGEESGFKQVVLEKYGSLVNAWEENRSRIRQSGTVGEFIEALGAFQRCMEITSQTCWGNWVNKISSDISIADAQLESVKSVLDYATPIQKYKIGRDSFSEKTSQVPNSIDEIQALINLSEKLKKIKSELKFNLPAKVLSFYDQLDREGTFPLGRFDSELSDWLTENGGLKDLSITRRRKFRF